MPEPTTAQNSSPAASAAPIKTSSKKTVMEEERDIDAPELVQKLAAATISAGSNNDKVEIANKSAGGNAAEPSVNEPAILVPRRGLLRCSELRFR